MKGGRLEVFLVSSKGIKNTSPSWTPRIIEALVAPCCSFFYRLTTLLLFLKPAYYVITECGTQVRTSKTSKGSRIAGHCHEIYWNDKLTFEFPVSECENLIYLKLKIMGVKFFGAGKFAGETIVDLKRIIMEGNDRGFIELTPRPYNVVLEDGTYKGELKIGLRFTPNTDIYPEKNELLEEDHEEPERSTVCKGLMNLCKMSRWRFSNFCGRLDNNDKHKEA